jgi:prepilin-type N-terminal cleavage/methylation domain-containing protein
LPDNIEHDRKVGCKGFTLIEILLAMLITSILIIGVNSAYRHSHSIWSGAEISRPIYHTARLITETLRDELAGLYFPPTNEDANDSFELLYLPNEKTELSFYTMSPSWKGSLESSRLAKVRYRFTKDTDAEKTLLERLEQSCAGEKIIGVESPDIVTEGLYDFKVWIVDPNSNTPEITWQESFSSKDTPPKALKILLRWQTDEQIHALDIETIILIPSQTVLKPQSTQ